jgi:endonuclease/exonuclease/phosphatase (EEP) superfamily protein YafD
MFVSPKWWRALLGLAGFGLVVVAMLPLWDWYSWWVIPTLQSLSLVWLFLGSVLIIVSALSRAGEAMVLSAVVVVAALVPLLDFSGYSCAVSSSVRLTVMSLNTDYGHADAAQIVQAVKKNKVDVLVLTEATTALLESLHGAGIAGYLPNELDDSVDDSSNGTVIMADRKMTELDVPKFTARAFAMPAVSMVVGRQTVILRAAHTYPPLPGWSDRWHSALKQLGQWQSAFDGRPLIMVGDFNATSAHPEFRKATDGLNNAAGTFEQSTWPANKPIWPFVTIDHIMSREMQADGFRTLQISNTDHLGISATMHVCRPGSS